MKIIKLTGTLNDHLKVEDILKKLVDNGAFTAKIASKEVGVEIPLDKLEHIKEVLTKLKISDVKVRESKLIETTVTQSGTGTDSEEVVRVALAPASRVCGHKMLRMFIDSKVVGANQNIEELGNVYSTFIRYILQKAGISDVIYSVEILKKRDDIESALEIATINAIISANGIIQIN